MTQIMSHGRWIPYRPDKLPELVPSNTLFCHRESDLIDWYDYVRDENNFTAGSVKFMARKQDDSWIISVASHDASMLHPADQWVMEVIDYHGGDPSEELAGRLFDPVALRLGDRPPIVALPDPLQSVLDRLAVIEAKLGIAS